MPPRLLDAKRWLGEQSWFWESLWETRGRVVRLKIRRNAYDFQSSMEAELFDGDRWNSIVWSPISGSFKPVSYAVTEFRQEWTAIFKAAEDHLLREVNLILAVHEGSLRERRANGPDVNLEREPMNRDWYLDAKCPFCGSNTPAFRDPDGLSFEKDKLESVRWCRDCHRGYKATYALVTLEEIKE